MKRTIVTWCALMVFAAAGATAQIQGTYNIYKGEVLRYKDVYSIEPARSAGNVVVSDEIAGVDVSYSREVKMSPGALDGEIMSEEVDGMAGFRAVIGGGFLSLYDHGVVHAKLVVEGGLFVFDPTVPTHYTALLSKFGGGNSVRSVEVLMPSKLDYWKVGIEPRPASTIRAGDSTLTAEVYRLKIGRKTYVHVFMVDGVAAAIYDPEGDVCTVEAKYPNLREKIVLMFKQAM